MTQTIAQRNARTAAAERQTDATLDYARDNPPVNGTWMKTWQADGDPCVNCAAMDGDTIDADATWNGVEGPPLHPNCVVSGTIISPGPGIDAVTRRNYRGEVIRIYVKPADFLAVTPNHPVLTIHGWVPAGLIREGSYVACATGRQGKLPGHENDDDMPVTIDEIAKAFMLRAFCSRKVIGSRKDFHGDGVNGEISVVWSNRDLMSHRESLVSQLGCYLGFKRPYANAIALTRGGALASGLPGIFLPSARGLGGTRASGFAFSGPVVLSKNGLLLHRSKLDAIVPEIRSDTCSGCSERVSDGFNAISGKISFNRVSEVLRISASSGRPSGSCRDFPLIRCPLLQTSRDTLFPAGRIAILPAERGKLTSRTKNYSLFEKYGTHTAGGYASGFPDIRQSAAGTVTFRKVIKTERRYLSSPAHVYNLQTSTGHYIANGIILKNCECALELNERYFGFAEILARQIWNEE
jgi:hypothetical protein